MRQKGALQRCAKVMCLRVATCALGIFSFYLGYRSHRIRDLLATQYSLRREVVSTGFQRSCVATGHRRGALCGNGGGSAPCISTNALSSLLPWSFRIKHMQYTFSVRLRRTLRTSCNSLCRSTGSKWNYEFVGHTVTQIAYNTNPSTRSI